VTSALLLRTSSRNPGSWRVKPSWSCRRTVEVIGRSLLLNFKNGTQSTPIWPVREHCAMIFINREHASKKIKMGLRLRTINRYAAKHGPQNFGILQLLGSNGENIAID
jgi:hypothetical protein